MTHFSEDEYEFKSSLTPQELNDRLSSKTLHKKFLGMVVTNKDFIGQVNQDNFKIIESSRGLPYGVACVLTGTIDSKSVVTVKTSVHKAFLILIAIWFVAITIMYFATSSSDQREPRAILGFIIEMLIGGALFRGFLHVMYVGARDKAIRKLKKILEVAL